MDATRPPAVRRSLAARCVPSRRTAVRLLAGSLATAASGGAVTEPALATHPGLNGKFVYESPIGGETSIFTLQPFTGRLNSDTRLTSRRWNAEDPAVSANGRRIAFVTNRDGNRDIYVMDNDGGRMRRLTFDPAKDSNPSFSKNGRTIAFTSTRSGSEDIWVMNQDGSAQTRLTTNPAAEDQADFSPVRRQIAFESNRNGNYELYSMEDDGSRQTRLTFHTANDRTPSWKPDGTSIAFTSRRMRGSDIFSLGMDPRNGRRQHRRGRRRLTRDPRENKSPAFSPDGKSIAFASTRFTYVRTFERRQARTRLAALGTNSAWGPLPRPSGPPEPLETVSIFPRGKYVRVELPGFDANPRVSEPLEIPIESIIGTGDNKVDLQVAVGEDRPAPPVRVSGGRATIVQEPRAASAQMKGGAAALETDGPPDTVFVLEELQCPDGVPTDNNWEVKVPAPTLTPSGQARASRRLTNLEAGALFAGPKTKVRGRYHTAGSRSTHWKVTNTCSSTTTEVVSGTVEIEEPGRPVQIVEEGKSFQSVAPTS
jgi:hypothetical protein